MNRVICVYASSSSVIDRHYFELAASLGREIARRKDVMLFGGGMIGLMGEVAKAVHQNNGKVIGVIPKALNIEGVVYKNCDELIETPGLRERKAIMDSRSDAFIALPGGYGTFEELLEIITLKQLKYHNKAVVIMNFRGYFDSLIRQFETAIEQGFAKPVCRELYHVTDDVSDALDYIDNYKPCVYEDKWLT